MNTYVFLVGMRQIFFFYYMQKIMQVSCTLHLFAICIERIW